MKVWIVAAVFLGGCVTSGEGTRMRAEIARLGERVDAMDRRDAEINEQVQRLRKVLDQATALLSRNSADVGEKVARHESELALLTGQIEEAKHLLDQIQKKMNDEGARLVALEDKQQKIADRVAPSIPEDKDALWKEAQARMNGGMREDARRFFRAYVQRFPTDARSPQAQILIGQSLAAEGKHTQAAAEYQKVLDQYPKAAEVPEAMFFLGQSFVELKFCTDARVLFQDVAKRFPRSPAAKEVRQRLRDLQKIARDKKRCTS